MESKGLKETALIGADTQVDATPSGEASNEELESFGWHPIYAISTVVVRALMRIEAARAVVEHTPLPPSAAEELRRRARLKSTHFSTRIEGNRLTLEETEQVLSGKNLRLIGRERDVREVKNYWNTFLYMEDCVTKQRSLTDSLIQRLHAMIEKNVKAKPTPYRDGQNVIRDASTGRIVYLPPMSQDVPKLMKELIEWCDQALKQDLPVPLIAGLLHYQFVTIHPFYDGNGRTARLLATYLLHIGGYSLNGIFSLEEHHAIDLDAYYAALSTHPHHNYYEGRAEADLTHWLEYFVSTLSRVFSIAEEEALRIVREGATPEPDLLRKLDARTRRIFSLFAQSETIAARDVATLFGISDRAARALMQTLVIKSVLEVANSSNRARVYALSEVYRQVIGSLSEAVKE